VAEIKLETFDSPDALRQAEESAIRRERPLHNKRHNRFSAPSAGAPADEMQRVTLYMPREIVRALKQAGLDGDTSMSQILTGLADEWLADEGGTAAK
jgi:hypothetical protein